MCNTLYSFLCMYVYFSFFIYIIFCAKFCKITILIFFLLCSEFELLNMYVERNLRLYSCCEHPYPEVTYYVHLRRRPMFYVFNMLLPCFLITLVALLGNSMIYIYCLTACQLRYSRLILIFNEKSQLVSLFTLKI